MSLIYDSIEQWFAFLDKHDLFRIDLTLERMQSALADLGIVSRHLAKKKIITVAGTNGKGTTVALLSDLLKQNGYRVGSYFSPHLFKFNERIQINLKPISDVDLLKVLNTIGQYLLDFQLTYFELTTLAALYYFQQSDLDYLVLEVGLGGRLDAVNAIDHDLAMITNVELDHMKWLGSDRESIAFEKAGIIRPLKPVIVADQSVPLAIKEIAEKKKAPLYVYGGSFRVESHIGYTVFTQNAKSDPIQSLLHAPQQIASVAYAYQLLEKKFPEQSHLEHAAALPLPARCQLIEKGGRQYLLDVAHNEAAIIRLVERLIALNFGDRIHVIFGALSDKSIGAMFGHMIPYVDHWYIAPLQVKRTASCEQLKRAMLNNHIEMGCFYDNIALACQQAKKAAEASDLLVVTGSFYTVSELVDHL